MRKIRLTALVILAAFALLCTACSGNVNPDSIDFDRSYSLTAQFEYGGNSSTAQFTRTAPDEWSGTLTEPYSLQGVEISYTPLEMSVSYSGFSVDLDSAPPNVNVTAFLMLCALESAFKGDATSVTSGKDWVEITGRTDGDTYVLTLNRVGLPVSLDVPARQLKITFSDVTVKNF
ncbi:MAG: hypothetical protein FWD48_08360 [Oscillospiraceae bacterium]|nr:hypothetical protein [Oscillospiraceae bacterium]